MGLFIFIPTSAHFLLFTVVQQGTALGKLFNLFKNPRQSKTIKQTYRFKLLVYNLRQASANELLRAMASKFLDKMTGTTTAIL